jgi:preprotein translocase subunit SecE
VTETREDATPDKGPGDKRAKKAKAKKAPIGARIGLFLRQMVAELRKVIWPTRRELITYTTVVVFFVAVMMLITGLLDIGFTKVMFQVFS